MGAIKGVAEVVINVHDIAGMQAFYERTLGFTFHSRFPDPDPTIVFLTLIDLHSPLGRGGHPQLFALVDPARHIPDTFVGLDVDRSSLNHLAFEIDETDFESELQRLKALGLETTVKRFRHMSAKAIFFNDPEGNRIELICHDGEGVRS